ncbi:MAG: Maf family protein [Bacilli bacterium]|nr:Maf family protein [Bacilli bacterium]
MKNQNKGNYMIVLASGSPRRKELLSQRIQDFKIIVPQVNEDLIVSSTLDEIPLLRATKKALEVSKDHPNDLVIGADTVVIIDNQLLGKPRSEEEARWMLETLSNRTHKVLTSCCLILNNQKHYVNSVSLVTFRKLSEAEISAYIKTKSPYDKAGGYGIQDSSHFVASIEGDYNNVMGLPLAELMLEINKLIKTPH